MLIVGGMPIPYLTPATLDPPQARYLEARQCCEHYLLGNIQ